MFFEIIKAVGIYEATATTCTDVQTAMWKEMKGIREKKIINT